MSAGDTITVDYGGDEHPTIASLGQLLGTFVVGWLERS
jgi:hypothetical protein